MLSALLSRVVRVLAVVAALAAGGVSTAQCPRSWVAAPDGVWGGQDPEVRAMCTWDPDGAGPMAEVLVVAGAFTAAADIGANNVAYWDGSAWHPLGQGLDGPVNTVVVFNGDLYAGGAFTSSGGVPLHNFAHWNPAFNFWEEAGFGTDGPVYCLAANGSELLVGGAFTHEAAGTTPYQYLARYSSSGVGWNGYSPQPPSPVFAVAPLFGRPVIITRQYVNQLLFGQQVSYWSGSTWDFVRSDDATRNLNSAMIAADGAVIFTGVSLPLCNNNSHSYAVYVFDGTVVHQLSTSFQYNIWSYAWSGTTLYALGEKVEFSCPLWSEQPLLAAWNGASWTEIGNNPGIGSVLGVYNGSLYVGGSFDRVRTAGGMTALVEARNISRSVSGQWGPMVSALDGAVRASTTGFGSFAIGGDFNNTGITPLNHMADLGAAGWITGGNFNGSVTSLLNYSVSPPLIGTLVASGYFTQIGTDSIAGIARYDTSLGRWVAMGSGLNGAALAMIPVSTSARHNDLVAGGFFTTADGALASHVARWNGASWAAMGTGMNSNVQALAVYGGQVVAGGAFTIAGGHACSCIARWDGANWQPLGTGMNAGVRALTVYNGQLIAGGDFTSAGGTPVSYLAAWNGTAWSSVDVGTDGPVYAMAVDGASLVVGGFFMHAGSIQANSIAEWDGAAWHVVGIDTDVPGAGVNSNSIVLTLSVAGTDLLAGGTFFSADGQLSPFAARAVGPTTPVITGQPVNASAPAGGSASFTVTVDPGGWFVYPSYQWYLNGVALTDGTSPSGTVYGHTNQATLLISNVSPADAGSYWCTVSIECSANSITSSSAQLTVAGCCTADFNHDGDSATDLDIEDFFACIAGNCCATCCSADFNGDGDSATDADIESFFRVLAGGAC
jgi:hypothetical protein